MTATAKPSFFLACFYLLLIFVKAIEIVKYALASLVGPDVIVFSVLGQLSGLIGLVVGVVVFLASVFIIFARKRFEPWKRSHAYYMVFVCIVTFFFAYVLIPLFMRDPAAQYPIRVFLECAGLFFFFRGFCKYKKSLAVFAPGFGKLDKLLSPANKGEGEQNP